MPSNRTLIKICAASIKVSDNLQTNLQTMWTAIQQAAKRKCSIVCFPEVCLISEVNHARNIAKEIAVIKNWAIKYKIAIIFGSYCLVKQQLRNQIIAIDCIGTVKMRYNKRHPYIEEQQVIAGNTNKAFYLAGIKIGVINCYDYAYPEEIRELSRQGAKIIFCPSYLLSHPITSSVLERIPQVRAFDALAYFVMVDAQAEETFGVSRICHPTKELSMLKGEGLLVAKIDLSVIPKLRKHFKIL